MMDLDNRELKNWQSLVFASVGLDPRVCPICGYNQKWAWNNGEWSCICFSRLTERADFVLSALTTEGEFFEPLLSICDRNNQIVAGFLKGKRNTRWKFFVQPSDQDTDAVKTWRLIHPIWWPTETLAKLDQERDVLIQEKIALRKEDVLIINRAITKLGEVQLVSTCDECAQASCLRGRAMARAQENLPLCDNIDFHPERILALWQKLLNDRKELFRGVFERTDQKQDLAELLKANGFFRGKLKGVPIPQGSFWVDTLPKGVREVEAPVLLCSNQITLEQFKNLIIHVPGTHKIVQEKDGITIHTTDPKWWRSRNRLDSFTKVLGKINIRKHYFTPDPTIVPNGVVKITLGSHGVVARFTFYGYAFALDSHGLTGNRDLTPAERSIVLEQLDEAFAPYLVEALQKSE